MGVKLLDNPMEIVVDVILTIIIIVLFPLLYLGLKQDTLTQTIVEIETKLPATEMSPTSARVSGAVIRRCRRCARPRWCAER